MATTKCNAARRSSHRIQMIPGASPGRDGWTMIHRAMRTTPKTSIGQRLSDPIRSRTIRREKNKGIPIAAAIANRVDRPSSRVWINKMRQTAPVMPQRMFQGNRLNAPRAPERHRANDGSENFMRYDSFQLRQLRFDFLEIRQLPRVVIAF